MAIYAPLTERQLDVASSVAQQVAAASRLLELLKKELGHDERAIARKRWINRKVAELSDISSSLDAWR